MLRFGTDGVRGDAENDLTSALVFSLGRAAARVLGREFVVGRDTRESGRRIERDFRAGVGYERGTARTLGVLPTPGVAYYAQRFGAAAAVISASHNPWTDNGIKLLAPGGRKLDDGVEARIEAEMSELDPAQARWSSEAPRRHGHREYVEHLVDALDGRNLDGMRVVLDCANGAACEVGPEAFAAAGADVTVIHAAPDGRNINAGCGSTHPGSMQEAVRSTGADVGLALDGDADRVIAADERGELVDGDQIMTALALDLQARGRLDQGAIAVTVMSNLGLRRALHAAGIEVVETPVGDRNVLATLDERGLALGGEQSGHVIVPRLATTGDGVLTGLLLCDLAARSGRRVSELGAQMERFPQVLENVTVRGRPDLGSADELRREVAAVEAELGDRGRVLVRASGTEPLIRVMVEAATEDEARAAVSRLRKAVERAFPADQNS